ncbi:hypothetical protein EV360DRAFT_86512 [Lentinula raphanica]|nr:hypothetical protein EV360DRAFT_86512 [Lentinula raphanica]
MPRASTSKLINESSCRCGQCGVVLQRPSDMRRHMRTHGTGMTEVKYQCTWDGCSFEAFQRSNFETHYRTHIQDKSQVCPSCEFKTCDPGSLTRHRKRIHGYVPKPRRARVSRKQQEQDQSQSPLGSSEESSSSSSDSPELFPTPILSLSNLEPPVASEIDAISGPCILDCPSTDFVDLFCEPNLLNDSGFDILRPRPLFPAVDSAPPLETSNSLHALDLSLFFAEGNQTVDSGLTADSYVDGQNFWEMFSQGGFGGSACSLLPTSYDSFIRRMQLMDPSMTVMISDNDFRVIFGCSYEHFVAAKARASSNWSERSRSSRSVSPATGPIAPPPPKPFTGSLLAELYAPFDP